MSEGPEVRRIAATLHDGLAGSHLMQFETQLKKAKGWLADHPDALTGREFRRVFAVGKNILFELSDELWFRSHPLMWGKWLLYPAEATIPHDPHERVHLYTERAQALFIRGQVFDIVLGDPFSQIPTLAQIGPDICEQPFDNALFRERLLSPANLDQEVAPVLLLQEVAAGLGNYFKSDVLNVCRINPRRKVRDLTAAEVECLAAEIPAQAQRSLTNRGFTIPQALYEQLATQAQERGGSFNYRDRHWAFRRSGQPCFNCGTTLRQARTGPQEGRLTYFCPNCQAV